MHDKKDAMFIVNRLDLRGHGYEAIAPQLGEQQFDLLIRKMRIGLPTAGQDFEQMTFAMPQVSKDN